MKDLQDIVIVVKNTDGDSLEIVINPGSDDPQGEEEL